MEKVLVIAVDRDNDYGEKGKVTCPVVGRDNVIRAVEALGLADPEDSDVNVGFAAIKIADELGGEVAIVCGKGKGSVEADLELMREIDELKKMFPDYGVVVVGDGAEDESVLPLLSSRFDIISVERVTVKQLENFETTFYIVLKYLKEISNNPETSKILLGIPGIILLLIGLSIITSVWYPGIYNTVKNLLLGFAFILIAGYAIKKGFNVEFTRVVRRDVISTFTYVTILFAVVLSLLKAYGVYKVGGGITDYVMITIRLVVMMVFIYGLGKGIGEYLNGREKLHYYVSLVILTPALYSTLYLVFVYVFESVKSVFVFGAYGVVILVSVFLSYYVGKRLKNKVY